MPDRKLRSPRWFGQHDLAGFLHRSSVAAAGLSRVLVDGRPVVGICNSWSEMVSCNMHFRGIAEAVKRGVLMAGGLPLEFPTISLSENLMKPTAMLFRNLMAMDVEESIRAHPFDSVVLLGGCDKTVPAQLMGAASANVPALSFTGGPANPAMFRGRRLGVGTDLWHYVEDVRSGAMAPAEFDALEAAAMPSVGHCPELGTASTMAAITEALGMALPGTATIPATDSRRMAAAEAAGRRAVELAREGLTPREVLTRPAFENAVALLMAIGGSTNAVVHLLALARRVGVELTLADFDRISRATPVVTSLRPSGDALFADLDNVGGIPAVLSVIAPLLHLEAIGVTGRTFTAVLEDQAAARSHNHSDTSILATIEKPFLASGGIAVVTGSLAPRGAVIKQSAASSHLLQHRGRALVFDGVLDLADRIDDPDLDVEESTVLVLRGIGPVGGPGMPEWGQIPIPGKLLRLGVRDMVRISDGRMSGTAFGTVVLHVSPESAVGGPLASVRTGDWISLDVQARRLELEVPESVVAERLRSEAVPASPRRGYQRLYREHVTQADQGCDFDFLAGEEDADDSNLPEGLLGGWQGGW